MGKKGRIVTPQSIKQGLNKMINHPYKIDQVKNEIAHKKRAESRQFAVLGALLFVMYVTVSTMGYNDCINLGVC